jgi:hypothetical protein
MEEIAKEKKQNSNLPVIHLQARSLRDGYFNNLCGANLGHWARTKGDPLPKEMFFSTVTENPNAVCANCLKYALKKGLLTVTPAADHAI